jgi:tRNA(Ile2)-agmatinylcytidine synthase
MLTEFHIGIDDTDSQNGGCTTYTAAVLFDQLCERNSGPIDFPWLVRLNPNIPWKTRGNGALSIHLLVDEDSIEELIQISIDIVGRTSDLSARRTDPALAFLTGEIPSMLAEFSERALHDVLSVKDAERVAKKCNITTKLLKGKRGIVGALAALGAELDSTDSTFEILTYRLSEFCGTPREVDQDSVWKMDSVHRDSTFHNIDRDTGRILICSHGPDPVLFGIRGNDPEDLVEALREVRIFEPVERIMIFRTNQGTDAHIKRLGTIAGLEPYQSIVLSGRVDTTPRILRGGHVMFRVSDETGSIDCLAFEPSGSLNRAARELLPGDRVRVSGGVRLRSSGTLSLNLEKLEIVQLSLAFREDNPICPACRGRCESMGKGQGFRCKKCGVRPGNLMKNKIPLERSLNGVYIPPTRSRRHLTMPEEKKVSNRSMRTMIDPELLRLLREVRPNFHRHNANLDATCQNF